MSDDPGFIDHKDPRLRGKVPAAGEAAALRGGRCQLKKPQIEVVESLAEVRGTLHLGTTETQRRRAVTIPYFLRDLLAQHLAEHFPAKSDALVFTSPELADSTTSGLELPRPSRGPTTGPRN